MSTTEIELTDGYINGYGKPRFIVIDTDRNQQIYDVTLPYTMENGMIEKNIEESARHVLQNYKIVKEVYGYRKEFTMYYDTYANKDLLFAIDTLLWYEKRNFKIRLYPRSDTLKYSFVVKYTGEPIELGIHKKGLKAIGNKLVILKWESEELSDEVAWKDPDDVFSVWEYDNMIFTN